MIKMPSRSYHKIIINHTHNLNKIQSIIKSKNPKVLLLESEESSLNLKTNSIAYKLVMDDDWKVKEMKSITKGNPEEMKLLKVNLISSLNNLMGDPMRHTDAEGI